MTGILDLPPELIEHIVSWCGRQSVFATRLTHRYLEEASFDGFGRRFFRKKGFLITTESLNVLASIGKHRGLRKCVEHIWFNPDFYTFRYEDDRFAEEEREILAQTSGYGTYLGERKDHHELLYGQKLQDAVLPSLFRNLPNMKVVGMRRSTDHYPWGCNRLKRTTGLGDPRVIGHPWSGFREDLLSEATELFKAIEHALASLETHRLERLYTDTIELDGILPEDLNNAVLAKANVKLTQLELNLTIHCSDALTEVHRGKSVARLLQSMPDLQSFSLAFLTSNMEYTCAVLNHIVLANAAETLLRLKLDSLEVDAASLTSFLEASSATLTHIKLGHIELRHEAPNSSGESRVWDPVFTLLRDRFLCLEYLLCLDLTYRSNNSHGVRMGSIEFQKTRGTSQRPDGAIDGEGGVLAQHSDTVRDEFALECRSRGEVTEDLACLEFALKYADEQGKEAALMNNDHLWYTDTSDEQSVGEYDAD
ncbi:hypothetical protein MBLNU230_g2183t1 [Neophaeotheca triangularis]